MTTAKFWRSNGVGRVSKVHGAHECRGYRVPDEELKIIFPHIFAYIVLSPAQNSHVITIHNYLCCTGVLCTWVKRLTDLQNLGCELNKMRLAAGLHLDPLGEL